MQYSNINPVFSKDLSHPADVVEVASLVVSHLDPCLCPFGLEFIAFARCRMCPSSLHSTTFGSLFQKNCCCLVIYVCVCVCVYVCVSASMSVCLFVCLCLSVSVLCVFMCDVFMYRCVRVHAINIS